MPLHLGSLVLRERAAYAGPGEHTFQYDEQRGEYVVWLRGKSEQPHRLTLQGLIPLITTGGETHLKLDAPRAWQAELNFTVPADHASATVSSGAMLEATTYADDQTRFKVVGLGHDFALAWRTGAMPAGEAQAALEIVGGLTARLDGRNVQVAAQLMARSFGGAFDRFQVRLPRGATLVSTDQPEYTLHTIEEPAEVEARRTGALVEVRLRTATVGPVPVRLTTTQPQTDALIEPTGEKDQAPPADHAGDWLVLSGFEVPKAVRQWGHLAVQVSGDWQASFGRQQQVRQVESLPAELLRDEVTAGFEYAGQPFSLAVRLTPRQTRIVVEPEHRLDVHARRVDLETRLHYRITGGKTFALEFDAGDWQLDAVDPPQVVNLEQLAGQGAVWTVPLLRPTSGVLDLTIRAHRTLPGAGGRIELRPPQPRNVQVADERFVVSAADDVELTPRLEAARDLEPLRATVLHATAAAGHPGERPALVYRGRGADSRFVADVRFVQRSLSFELNGQVTLEADNMRVEQRWAVAVTGDAVDALMLRAAPAVVENGELRFNVDGKPATWTLIDDPGRAEGADMTVRVALPQPKAGHCSLTARYALAIDAPAPQASVAVQAPLLMPLDGETTTASLKLTVAPELQAQVLDRHWRAAAGQTIVTASRPVELSSTTAQDELSLALRQQETDSHATTTVTRAWVQSWLGAQSRQDRAVYRVLTSQAQVALQLPTGVIAAEVSVDGQRVGLEEGVSVDRLTIPLPVTAGHEGTFTIDVRYRFAERHARAPWAELALQAPTFDSPTNVRRTYWQLVLPADEYVFDVPERWTAENAWSWLGLGFGRRPVLDQAELEVWTEARHEPALPASVHTYLYSSPEALAAMSAPTVRRSVLVLIGSGAVLLAGLLLLYIPATRRNTVLLGASVACGALAAVYAEPALLFAQAAALGALLALLAGGLKRLLRPQRTLSRAGRNQPSVVVERGSTRTQPHYRPATGSLSATTAAAVPMPASAPEGPS